MSVRLPNLGKSIFSFQPRRPLPVEEEPTAPELIEPALAGPAQPEPVQPELAAPPSLEDEAALVAAARTDSAAFGRLYERYVDRVYAYIFHRVGNAQDAEDLTARTFYRALDKLDTYEDRGLPFSAWLFRIAHNLTANWHRDHKQRHFLSLDRLWGQGESKEVQASPEEHVTQQEEQEALMEAISRLPEERRNLLHYKFGTSLSNLEIGELMNKSESAIKSLYFRTLAALREDLENRGWGSGSTEANPPVLQPNLAGLAPAQASSTRSTTP